MVAGALTPDRPGAAAVRVVRVLLVALDLATVADALEEIGPASLRAAVLVLVALVGMVLVFVAAVLAAGVLAQRQPPYPM
jgi:hypothetical protein